MDKSDNKCSFSLETLGKTVTVLRIINVFCSVRKTYFFRTEKLIFSVRKYSILNFSVRKK